MHGIAYQDKGSEPFPNSIKGRQLIVLSKEETHSDLLR